MSFWRFFFLVIHYSHHDNSKNNVEEWVCEFAEGSTESCILADIFYILVKS